MHDAMTGTVTVGAGGKQWSAMDALLVTVHKMSYGEIWPRGESAGWINTYAVKERIDLFKEQVLERISQKK